MSDTIELLESIGKDATLRHATGEELAHILDQANAAEPLKAAVANGDCSTLSRELGGNPMHATHVTQEPCHEDEPDQDDDDSGQSPEPDRGEPPQQK